MKIRLLLNRFTGLFSVHRQQLEEDKALIQRLEDQATIASLNKVVTVDVKNDAFVFGYPNGFFKLPVNEIQDVGIWLHEEEVKSTFELTHVKQTFHHLTLENHHKTVLGLVEKEAIQVYQLAIFCTNGHLHYVYATRKNAEQLLMSMQKSLQASRRIFTLPASQPAASHKPFSWLKRLLLWAAMILVALYAFGTYKLSQQSQSEGSGASAITKYSSEDGKSLQVTPQDRKNHQRFNVPVAPFED